MKEKDPRNISTKELFAKGSITALMVIIPSLGTFGVSWYLLDDLIQAAIIGGVVHFIALIFSFKISKKFFVNQPDTNMDL